MASLVNTTLLLCIFAFYDAIWLDGMTYAARIKKSGKFIVDSADEHCQNLINEKSKKKAGEQPMESFIKGKTTECGDTYSTATGTINHPAISDYYENNEMCSWTVRSSVPLYFSFSKFSTEIEYDLLIVRDGSSIGSPLLETLSGKSLSSTFVTTGDAYITFESDSDVISTGFILHWRIYTAEEQCRDKNGTCLQTGDRCRGLVDIIINSCEDYCGCCLIDGDINECNDDNGGCSQNCHNTHGSFSCSCQVGYTLDVDGKTCIDIDECLDNNGGCNHHCTNTEGSYDCSCQGGYSLGSNNKACIDIDECFTKNGDCAHQCTNTEGSYRCSCHRGYLLGSNNMACFDIDECLDYNGDCGQQCTNTEGSYVCSCDKGYSLGSNNMDCIELELPKVNVAAHGGIARASSSHESGNYPPMNAFGEAGFWHSLAPYTLPQSLWMEFGEPLRIVKYSFTSRTDNIKYVDTDGPSEYIFWASNYEECNEESQWDILYRDNSGTPFAKSNDPKIVTIENNDFYRCYGFKVTNVPGRDDEKAVTIANIHLYSVIGMH